MSTGRLGWIRKRVSREEADTDVILVELLRVVEGEREHTREILDKLGGLEQVVGASVVHDLEGRLGSLEAKVDRLYTWVGVDEDGFLVDDGMRGEAVEFG